jgi:hypothetical protein
MALIAFAVAAGPAAPTGIWEGTVGDLPVRACFAHQEWGSFGSYYYLSRRRLIALEAEEGASGAFRENDARDSNAPRWVIEGVDAGRLAARWTHRGRTLPVRFRHIAAADREQDQCAGMTYHRPRLAGVRTASTRASRDGVAYTRIILEHGGRFDASFETFALEGAGPAAGRINAILSRALRGDPPEWFDCIRTPLGQGPNEGSFHDSLEPAMISRRWMSVIDQSDAYCGGNHPNAGRTYRAFDLARGREIDLHDWLNAAAVEREGPAGSEEEIKTLRPALRGLILAGWHADVAECDEVVRTAESWNIGLTRGALVFSPDLPHVVQACGEEFTIPFGRLWPFLIEEAAANLRALAAEGSHR